jgi:hypothetical protein|tara:strand:- start:102 stop:347 length:246 start_codon:yes stop_codon:yes gene_type:complete
MYNIGKKMKYTIIVTTLAFIISCSSLPLTSKSWGMKENTNICFFNNKGNPICQKKLNGTILCGKTEVGQEICVDMTPATIY